VFPEAEGISDERMMQIAREMNLSETVFVLQPDGGDDRVLRRLRIFTPASRFRSLDIRSALHGRMHASLRPPTTFPKIRRQAVPAEHWADTSSITAG